MWAGPAKPGGWQAGTEVSASFKVGTRPADNEW